MLEGIDTVIFDLDGTLVDSMWMWRAIDIEYLGRFGHEYPKDLQESVEGMSFSEIAIYFKEKFQLTDDLDTIKRDWNEMAYDKYMYEVPVKPGVIEFLTMLKRKGIKTGIATSNSKELLVTVLNALNITEYFDEVHTCCEVAKGKPEPDIYLYVADCLNSDPKHCLVFEDLPFGIQAGKSAGMKVCAVWDHYSEAMDDEKKKLADYYISSFEEII